MSVAAPGLSPIIDGLGFNLDVKVNSSGVDDGLDRQGSCSRQRSRHWETLGII
jgi:hypothetical protein